MCEHSIGRSDIKMPNQAVMDAESKVEGYCQYNPVHVHFLDELRHHEKGCPDKENPYIYTSEVTLEDEAKNKIPSSEVYAGLQKYLSSNEAVGHLKIDQETEL